MAGNKLARWVGSFCLLAALALTGPTTGWVQEKGTPVGGETWWSLRPITKPELPPISPKHPEWNSNPIDRFIGARLRDKGFQPAPPADRRTLIRRLKFDLVGLPPTPEEIGAFLNDKTSDAYEKLVDRLLASPHYGERWARHWMDVIHFAETHGHDQDVPREHAWPYRDYLIQAFNSDKPYSRFVEEQIAGDVLFANEPNAIPALGFLAAGPWDESSLKDIREDSIDRKAGQYLDRDDMITTVGLAFLSTTVQCARCHDHKFDPIGQEEYYRLQAVFAGIDRANRSYEDDPKARSQRTQLARLQTELKAGPAAVAKLLQDPAHAAAVAAWEKTRSAIKDPWTVLNPDKFVSRKGATAARLADQSILFSGKKPEKDTYVIEANTDLKAIVGVRLEVMSDDSLPHKGPGRQDNGNLHLSEFKVEVLQGKERKSLPIASAYADFNQAGWEIDKAIDGNPATAWGIYPQVGQAHTAVFMFKEPIQGPARLIFILDQQHGGGHLIGRPRLSAASHLLKIGGAPLVLTERDARFLFLLPPENVQKILATKADQRSDAEKIELATYALTSKVETDLAALPAPRLVYAAASEFTTDGSFRPAKGCRPIHVLKRGDINRPGKAASPGALECVEGLESRFKLQNANDEGQRRAALAKWISDPRNPLTWRSIVNRVWQHHFGRGLVATANDFGKMGSGPSHPELLDWLTSKFQEDGGSLKKLHRLIVTSAAYRQSSRHHAEYAKADADNVYLWRMNRTRLDAESVRDAVLVAAGKLDTTMGGPSVKHFKQSPGIHRTPKVDYDAFDPDSPGAHRRSIYRFIFRTLPDPFMDALDCPDASQFIDRRAESVTPLQALALLNDPFMVRMSEHFAKRIENEGSVENQLRQAYRYALGREPTEREVQILSNYATRHGMANACRVLLNCNEFMYVP